MTPIAIVVFVLFLLIAIRLWKIDRIVPGRTAVGWDATTEDAPAPSRSGQEEECGSAETLFGMVAEESEESDREPSEPMSEPAPVGPQAMPATPAAPAAPPPPVPMPAAYAPPRPSPPSAPPEIARRAKTKEVVSAGAAAHEPAGKHLGLSGRLDAPSRIYVNDSCSVSVTLNNRGIRLGKRVGLRATPDAGEGGGEDLRINVEADDLDSTRLEIELLCAGAVVAGDTRQGEAILQSALHYHWNCFFPNAGGHSLDVVVRAVGPNGTRTLGVVHHPVDVVKLGGLSKAHAHFMARASAIVSAGAATVTFANEIGLLDRLWPS